MALDPVTGAALLGGLATLGEMVQKRLSREAPEAMREVMQELLKVQQQAFGLLNENQALKIENAEIQRRLSAREAVRLGEDGAIWREGDVPSMHLGGFCPNCFSDGQRLLKLQAYLGESPHRACTVCKWNNDGRWWE